MHLSVRIMRLFSFSCIDANWAERMSSECKAFKQKPLLTQSKALIQNKLRCHPQQLESFCVFAIKSAYAIRKTSEPFGISQSICTRTLRNLTRYLHRNLRNRTEPSGASAGIFTRTLRNLTRYLHQIPPERCPKPGVEAAPDRTGANLGQRPHSKVLLLGDKKTQLLLIFLLRSRGTRATASFPLRDQIDRFDRGFVVHQIEVYSKRAVQHAQGLFSFSCTTEMLVQSGRTTEARHQRKWNQNATTFDLSNLVYRIPLCSLLNLLPVWSFLLWFSSSAQECPCLCAWPVIWRKELCFA